MPLGANKAAIMGVAGATAAGDVVLLSSQTADDDATVSFTSGIDSTYGEYIFKFYVLNPANDNEEFVFQANASSQSGYNETITTTYFDAYHNEAGTDTLLTYETTLDQAQGTAFQILVPNIGNAADEAGAGELHLFNPSSTTYVKHFYARTNSYNGADYMVNSFVSGYFNTTAAIDDIQFKMNTGNFDGTIKMWGVK